MKKVLIAIGASALLFAGCQEKAPAIDFSDPKAKVDTTYIISPVPATEPHNVLAEEFTGQTCPNCPAAHELLGTLGAAGRLNVICLYIYGPTQTNTPPGAANDFRQEVGMDSIQTKIGREIYSGGPLSGLPCAGIDRVPLGGALQQYTATWATSYNQQLNVDDSLNLSVSSTYDPADSIALVTVLVTYTESVSTRQNLSIVIVEDSIIDKQEIPTGEEEHYVFTNVFRAMITAAPYGDPVIPAVTTKTPGMVNKRVYAYKVSGKWKPKNCKVIAFVHYSGSEGRKDVLQSKQTKLAP